METILEIERMSLNQSSTNCWRKRKEIGLIFCVPVKIGICRFNFRTLWIFLDRFWWMVGSYSWENAKTPNGFIGCTQSTTLFIGTWLIYDDAQHNATSLLLCYLDWDRHKNSNVKNCVHWPIKCYKLSCKIFTFPYIVWYFVVLHTW